MKGLELLKAWAALPDYAVDFVICRRWTPNCSGVQVNCEACGALLSAYPATKAKLGSKLHVICYENCLPVFRKLTELEFGGRIENNVLPEALRDRKDEK